MRQSNLFCIWIFINAKIQQYSIYVYLILLSSRCCTPHIYHPDYAWMLGICNKLDVIASCTFFAAFKSSFYFLTASVVSIIHLSHKIFIPYTLYQFHFLCSNPSTITSLTTISSSSPLSNSTMTGLSITIIFPRDIPFSWAAKLQQA